MRIRDRQTRVVRKFLWFPTNLPTHVGPLETRWLERAWIEQVYKCGYGWRNVQFVNIEKEEAK